MDSREYSAPSNETMSTTDPETQWNRQIFIPVLKQEIKNEIDEGYLHHSGYNMYSSEHSQLPNHVNYYDNKTHVFEQVKEELPGDEYPQADCSMNNSKHSENNILVNLIDRENIKNEHSEELPLNIKQEKRNEMYEVTIKLERLDKEEILDNAEDTSVYYDVQATPQETHHKSCGRTLKNSSNSLTNNDALIKIEINTTGDNEMKELHRCQNCDEYFNNREDMLSHVSEVHSEDNPKCALCGKQFKSVQGLKRHTLRSHKLKESPKGEATQHISKCTYCNLDFENNLIFNSHMSLCHPDKEIIYKCDTCIKQYKNKNTLIVHMKRTHYDFGRMFECWCGEKFRTPIHLTEHKSLQHSSKGKNEEHKCKDCDEVFNSKSCLTSHIQKSHCGYGRQFESDRGSEMQTPLNLSNRDIQQHDRLNDSANNGKVQCNNCQKTFTNNTYLMKHIRRVHYDYGKVFKCWCGKEFRTPYQLTEHKDVHNYTNIRFQCDTCQKIFKNRFSLVKHKRKSHGDYRRTYECWCGKEFIKPSELADHKSQQHDSKIEGISNDRVQCDSCKKFFNTKSTLLRHIMRIHYDYGSKVFKCWCGKVFRTPYHLSSHKSLRHDGKNYGTLTSTVQCDVCQKLYKSNCYLERHKKRMHCDNETSI